MLFDEWHRAGVCLAPLRLSIESKLSIEIGLSVETESSISMLNPLSSQVFYSKDLTVACVILHKLMSKK